MRPSLLLFYLIVAILALVFALSNPGYVTLRFGPYQTEQSTALVVLLSFLLGVLVGLLTIMPAYLKRTREIRQFRRQLNSASSAAGGLSLGSTIENPQE